MSYIEVHNTPLVKDAKIYRIISFEYFLDILIQKRICFVRPELWDDPFENFFLKQEIQYGNDTITLKKAQKELFGQCWTYREETDFMWRVYAPDKKGIKILTTIEKIHDAIDKNIKQTQETFKVGNVIYGTKEEIKEVYEKPISEMGLIWELNTSKSLFIKRDGFSDEKEFRLIYGNASIPENQNKVFISLEPNEFIEKVVIDPRLNKEIVKSIRETIELVKKEKNYSFEIEHSDLYSPPKLSIKLKTNS